MRVDKGGNMITIRKASYTDLQILKQLAQELIPSSFKGVLNTSQIDYMLDKCYSQQALQDAFDKGQEYFIASIDNVDIGVVSVIEHGPDLYLMQKIYVNTNHQGKGVGSALFEHLINYIKEKHQGLCTIELLINKHNPGLNFYIKRGMTKVRDTGLDMGDFFINEEVYSLKVNTK